MVADLPSPKLLPTWLKPARPAAHPLERDPVYAALVVSSSGGPRLADLAVEPDVRDGAHPGLTEVTMGIGGYSMGSGYVVGWGTLALINAGIAQGKNRSGLNWFLLSLLLGPIATFVLVAFMPKQPAP